MQAIVNLAIVMAPVWLMLACVLIEEFVKWHKEPVLFVTEPVAYLQVDINTKVY